jgi:hypothetical protein
MAGSEPPPSVLKATEFPTSEAVIREYPSRPEQLAALAVLLDLLQSKTEDKSALAIERQSDYRRTIARLDPPRATDDERAAARKLRRDASFQTAVVTEFLPAHAKDAARAAAVVQTAPADRIGTAVLWTALVAAVAAALLLPLAARIRGRR